MWIPEPTIPNESVNARVNKVLKESEETDGSGIVGGSKFLNRRLRINKNVYEKIIFNKCPIHFNFKVMPFWCCEYVFC